MNKSRRRIDCASKRVVSRSRLIVLKGLTRLHAGLLICCLPLKSYTKAWLASISFVMGLPGVRKSAASAIAMTANNRTAKNAPSLASDLFVAFALFHGLEYN